VFLLIDLVTNRILLVTESIDLLRMPVVLKM